MSDHDDDSYNPSLRESFGDDDSHIEDMWYMLMDVLYSIKTLKTRTNHQESVVKLQETLNTIMDRLTRSMNDDFPDRGFHTETSCRLIRRFADLEKALEEHTELLKKENVEAVERFVDRLVVGLIAANQKELDEYEAGEKFMRPFVHREIDDLFEVLETAFNLRMKMKGVITPREHTQAIQSIISKKVGRLCELLRSTSEAKPAPSEPEIIAYLHRMQEVKIDLHTIPEVFQDVDWAKFDEAMSAAFKPLQE
ncbi:MAG: hypothetical protein Q9191_002781 [Dirinaria sp. TL-2023a]